MTKTELYKALNYVNHSREKRLSYANLIINTPKLVLPLLEIMFEVNDKISCRAAWVFEFMCSKKLEPLIPHLDVFTKNISKIHLDSAVRPVAKVCELLAKTYYEKEASEIKTHLTQTHKEHIIEACFDWMINSKEKVAPKAYGMNALYHLGKEFNWIYPELIIILERDFATQSAAFKARARQILKKIKPKN